MPLPGALIQTPISFPLPRPWVQFFERLAPSSGGGSAAPANAEYVVGAANAFLPNELVATNSPTITVDLSVPNQIDWRRAALTGDVTAPANSNTTTLLTTGVTAGTYGDSTHVSQVTVDAKGRVTAATNVLILPSGFVPLLRTITTLTDAQIKALPTTAITVVAAQGSGNRVKILGLSMRLNATAGAYTNIGAANSYLAFTATGNTPGNGVWLMVPIGNDTSITPHVTKLTDFLGVAQATVKDLIPYTEEIGSDNTAANFLFPADSAGWDPGSFDNQGVEIQCTNSAGGNFTGGNAANTLQVTVYYCVEAL